jgi:hypothetical protein
VWRAFDSGATVANANRAFMHQFSICVSHLHCSYGSPIFDWLDPKNFVVEETGCKIKNVDVGIIQIGPFLESQKQTKDL